LTQAEEGEEETKQMFQKNFLVTWSEKPMHHYPLINDAVGDLDDDFHLFWGPVNVDLFWGPISLVVNETNEMTNAHVDLFWALN
jgi:hypothetical protein